MRSWIRLFECVSNAVFMVRKRNYGPLSSKV